MLHKTNRRLMKVLNELFLGFGVISRLKFKMNNNWEQQILLLCNLFSWPQGGLKIVGAEINTLWMCV